jgi:UDP-N-acetylmuramoyl-tripeptide--D-alanyl-D-alanine ligase
MFLLLNIFWLIRTSKFVLFWIYLWQLKEYHVGRFLDHFRTYKGKKLFLNYFLLSKIILLFLFAFSEAFFSVWFSILFLIYLFESLIFLKQLVSKSFKRPVKTAKTIFLSLISFAVLFLFLFLISANAKAPVYILLFDILTPVIVASAVLLFQPFFVIVRNNVLKKATKKIENLKSAGSNLVVIGITGSYGKTSTKEFLTTILSEKFKVLNTKQHQNSEIAVANCILNDLKPEHQIFIAEVGAYNKGKVKEVCSMLKPKIGVVTGVNEQHLSLFGSMENLLSAEGGEELVKSLSRYNRGSSTESGPSGGLLVLNADNKYCLDLYKKYSGRKKIYSIKKDKIDSDIFAEDIEVSTTSLSFMAIDKNKHMAHFNLNVLGKQNVQNFLAAILVSSEIGMSLQEISEACKNIKPYQAGMTLKEGKYGINIIDSSYSANPDGVLADLDYLSIFPKKKIIIMPCLIELGKSSERIHEKIGRKIGKICDMAIITSKDKFEEIKKGATEVGMKQKNIMFCENADDIYSTVTLFCTAGDAILLEGRVPGGVVNLFT